MCLLSRLSRRPDAGVMFNTIHVGAASVTRIDLFDNWPHPPEEFFPGLDPATWQAQRDWLAPLHWDPATDRVHITVRSWLVRAGDLTVLVDTGLELGNAGIDVENATSLSAGLAGAGVEAADVDVVVCTHLHADHVGGNTRLMADGKWTPAFPNARYLFSRPDIEFFRTDRQFAMSVEPVLRSGRSVIWTDFHAIGEGLRLRLAPGHTPGLCVLTLESDGERAVFAGDLLHSPMQVRQPELSSRFCHAPADAVRSRRAVLGWAADHDALVLPAHFGGAGAVWVDRWGMDFQIRRWARFS